MPSDPPQSPPRRPGMWASLRVAMTSWRTASSPCSPSPPGCRSAWSGSRSRTGCARPGVDLRVVGLITLAQAPWTFKFLWSPVMDRWVPPFLGRRRGWIVIAQVALFATTLALAGVGSHPEAPGWSGCWRSPSPSPRRPTTSPTTPTRSTSCGPRSRGRRWAPRSRSTARRCTSPAPSPSPSRRAGRGRWCSGARGRAPALPLRHPARARARGGGGRSPHPAGGGVGAVPRILAAIARSRSCSSCSSTSSPTTWRRRCSAPSWSTSATPRSTAASRSAPPGRSRPRSGAARGVLTTSLGLGRALWLFGVIQILSNVGYHPGRGERGQPAAHVRRHGFESFTQGLGTGAFLVLLLR